MTFSTRLAITAVATAILLWGGAGDQAIGAKSPVKIGLLNPLSGAFALGGTDTNKGFDLYLKQHGGSLGGHPVQLVKEDDQTNPAAGLTKARKLVEQDRVDILVGILSSAVVAGLRDYVVSQGVPLLITVAAADSLTQQQAAKSIFRISYTGSQESQALASWVCKNTKHRTVSTAGLDYLFGWELSGGFAYVFNKECKGRVLQEFYSPIGTADWGPIIQQLSPSADALFLALGQEDAVRFAKQYKNFGGAKQIYGQGSLTDETILPSQGDNIVGAITASHYSAVLDNPANVAFVNAYKQAYSGAAPSQYSQAGWTAALVLDTVLATVDKTSDHEAVEAALRNTKIAKAPRGQVSFDSYQQAIFDVYIRKVEKKGNEYQNTVIDTMKNVGQFWTFNPTEILQRKPYAQLKGTWVNATK